MPVRKCRGFVLIGLAISVCVLGGCSLPPSIHGGQTPISLPSTPTSVSIAEEFVAATALPMPAAAELPATFPPLPAAAPTILAPPAVIVKQTLPSTAPVEVGEALLPQDAVWVRAGGRIATVGSVNGLFRFQAEQLAQPLLIHTAPNGSHIAYTEQVNAENHLVIINMRTGERRVIAHVVAPCRAGALGATCEPSAVFASDSSALALTSQEDAWRLDVLDLQTGERRTVRVSTDTALCPTAWVSVDLLVEQIGPHTGAPAQSLALIDPNGTAEYVLRQGEHLRAFAAPDGQRVALLTGTLPIGETPQQALAVLDPAIMSEFTLVEPFQGLIESVRWSPDSSKLFYGTASGYDAPIHTLYVIGANGSEQQKLVVDTANLDGAFRDAAWRDSSTLLVLAADADGQLRLYELSINAFELSSFRDLGVLEGLHDADGPAQIIYVPR